MLLKMTEWFKRPELYNWKFYCGTVVKNDDPKKAKRVRVTIDGLFPTGSDDSLPWCGALTDSPRQWSIPEVGDKLCVVFPFDDIYHPFYLGQWTTSETEVTYLQDDYPNTFGFIYANLKSRFNKNTKVGEIVHSSGSAIAVDADGNLVLTAAKDLTFTTTGKMTFNTTGDVAYASQAKLDLTSAADMMIKSGAKLTISSTGELMVKSDAKATFVGTGGTTVGAAASPTKVLGATVALGAEGGTPVALVGMSLVMGNGNLGAPVISQILTGASKVTAV